MDILSQLETIRQTVAYDVEQGMALLDVLIDQKRKEEHDFFEYLDREEAAADAMEERAA